ncbi:hypothetical protein, partial [Streptomyces sp. NPDC060022]|uniref:hypothetical protein n=1 Tax=Streptomyces sp. NPDC060022 TaxID=3347039 RepID=UPI00367692CC
GSDRLLSANLNDAYLRALQLVSGPDARLLSSVSEDDGAESRYRLREATRSLIRAAVGTRFLTWAAARRPEPNAPLPLLFTRDQRFSDSVSQRPQLEQRALELVDGMRDELMLHRRMAAEALEMLPPFPGRVWWTTEAIRMPSLGDEFELPQFHRVSTDMATALNASQGGRSRRALNVVWSVDRSSARDISPVARVAGERVVLYPAATRFRVASVSRGRRYDESTGRYFVHVTLAEVAPQGSERRGSEREWDPEILTVPARTGDGRDVGVMSFDARTGRVMRDVLAGLTDVTHGGGFTMMVQGGPHGFEVVSRFGPRLVSGSHWGAYLGNLLAERGLPAGTRIYAVERTSAVLGQAVADTSGHGFTAPVRIDGAVGAPRLLVADFEPRDRPVTDVTLRETHPAYTPAIGRFGRFYRSRQWSDLSWEYERGLGAILAADPEVLGAARHMLETLLPEGAQAGVGGADLTRLMAAVNMAAVSGGLIAVQGPRLLDPEHPRYRALRRERGFLLAERRSSIGRDLLEAYGERVPADRLPPARRAVVGWLLSTGEDSLYEVLSDTHGVAGGSPAERAVLLGDAAHLYAWAHAEFAVGTRLRTPYQTLYETQHRRLAVLASDNIWRATGGGGSAAGGTVPAGGTGRRRRDAVRDWIRRVPGRIVTLSRASGTRGEGRAAGNADALPSAQADPRSPDTLRDVLQSLNVPSSPLDSLTDGHITALYMLNNDPDRRFLEDTLDEPGGGRSRMGTLRAGATDSIRRAIDRLTTDPSGGRAAFPLLLAQDEEFGELIDEAIGIAGNTDPIYRGWVMSGGDDLELRFSEMADALLREIPQHVGMAAEALRSLPPVNSSMWLVHHISRQDVDAFRIPAFSRGALDRRQVMARLSEPGGPPGHRLLVEVVNSSARDVSFLSPTSGRTTAMYADRGMELVVQQRGWRHDADGNRYEYVQVTEVEPIAQFPVPVIGALVDEAPVDGAPVDEATLGAEEMPSRVHWNAPGLPARADVGERPRLPVSVPRYPRLYSDPSWPVMAAEYETGLGKVLAGDPGVVGEARDTVRALFEHLVSRAGSSPRDAASAFFSPGDLAAGSRPDEELSRLLAEEAGADLGTLMSMLSRAAFRDPSGVALSGMPPMPPVAQPHSPQRRHATGFMRGFRLTEGPAQQARWLFALYREVRGGDELLFREALLGWLLPSGEQSLVEVL